MKNRKKKVVEILSKKEEMYSFNGAEAGAVIEKVKINTLHDFKAHPFKVENDMELFELMKSIEKEGVLVPLLARPNPDGEGYEIIAGHRRKEACKWAGIDEVPILVVNMDDEQAIIAMVDSNLQREHIKPSEKAFGYRMKMEAIKSQGKRRDLTLSSMADGLENSEETTFYPMDKKLEVDNPTLELSKVVAGVDETGKWRMRNLKIDNTSVSTHANEIIGKLVGESSAQISRYVRLTYLISNILDMVDADIIAFRTAVELSYLKQEEQYDLHAVMDTEQCTPSLSQANRLKRMSQNGTLDMDMMYQLLEEEKPNQKEQIRIKADLIDKYFPKEFTPQQKVELIESLVKSWHQNQLGRLEKNITNKKR